MGIKEIIMIILSSTVVTALVTAVFNMLLNRRKEEMDNITKERKTWRDELRNISKSIQKSNDLDELLSAVSELKVRINAYGIGRNNFFADSHIWSLIFSLEQKENLTTEELLSIKQCLTNQISCILKYDWERSKAEIKGNMQSKIVIAMLIISFILYSLHWFYNFNISGGDLSFYFYYCFSYLVFAIFSILVIYLSDKLKERIHFIIFNSVSLVVFIILIVLILPLLHNVFDIFDALINILPIVVLYFCSIIKLVTYMKTIENYVISLAIACNGINIDKKYKVFFLKDEIKNPYTDEIIKIKYINDFDNLFVNQDNENNSK